MSSPDTDEDKQFDASEQKLRRARDEGDIPRSQELSAALSYLGLWGALGFAAAWLVPNWLAGAARLIGSDGWPDADGMSVFDLARALTGQAALYTVAILGVIGLPVLIALIVQRSITFTPKKVSPDINRVNPLKNAGQKFGASGMVTFLMSLVKAALVAFGGFLLFKSLLHSIMSADGTASVQWVVGLDHITRRALYLALGIGLLISAIDLIWKRFEYMRRHRMSRKELQDEYKESEGDPHFRAARRQKGVDIVMNAMLADVEKADVVIVNPTHYAVALEWKRGSGRAPVCLAKGVDEIARRIRERAVEHQVPIWSDPPCARAIHATVEIGQEIRTEQFGPVAAAIRFAEAMRKKARGGWTSVTLNSQRGPR